MAERKACTGKQKCLQFPQAPKRSVSIMIAKPSLIASLVIAAVSAVVAKDSDNLALNPSFENADAVGVIADDWVTRAGIPVERCTDGGHTGAAYARFRDDDPKGGQFLECHRLPARPGGVYTAAGWFRTTDK